MSDPELLQKLREIPNCGEHGYHGKAILLPATRTVSYCDACLQLLVDTISHQAREKHAQEIDDAIHSREDNPHGILWAWEAVNLLRGSR